MLHFCSVNDSYNLFIELLILRDGIIILPRVYNGLLLSWRRTWYWTIQPFKVLICCIIITKVTIHRSKPITLLSFCSDIWDKEMNKFFVVWTKVAGRHKKQTCFHQILLINCGWWSCPYNGSYGCQFIGPLLDKQVRRPM